MATDKVRLHEMKKCEIMYNKIMNNQALEALIKSMNEVSHRINQYGGNYNAFFGIESLGMSIDTATIKSVLNDRFQMNIVEPITLLNSSVDKVIQSFEEAFAYRGDSGSGTNVKILDDQELKTEETKLINELKIIFKSVNSVLITNVDPYVTINWSFSYVLIRENEETLLIYGGTID